MSKSVWKTLLLTALFSAHWLLAGCVAPLTDSADKPGRTNTADVATSGSDLLAPGDIIIINFSGVSEPPPAHTDRVREDGIITLPFLGSVHAAGRTRAQLQKDITNLYVPKYFKQLTVNVNADIRYFYVSGEVKAPNKYAYLGQTTVLKAIATAGDFGDFANRKRVQLTRANGKRFIVDCIKAQTKPELDLPVYPDDRVNVPRRIW